MLKMKSGNKSEAPQGGFERHRYENIWMRSPTFNGPSGSKACLPSATPPWINRLQRGRPADRGQGATLSGEIPHPLHDFKNPAQQLLLLWLTTKLTCYGGAVTSYANTVGSSIGIRNNICIKKRLLNHGFLCHGLVSHQDIF